MKISLRNKLSASYIIIVLISVFSISVFINYFLDSQFKEYVEKNQEEKNRNVVSSVSNQIKNKGILNHDVIDPVGVNSLENGLIIKVKDKNGNMVWDATVHNNGMCQKIIEKMAINHNSQYKNVKGSYTEKPYPIIIDDVIEGYVDIGIYGPFYLSDSDVKFLDTLNKMLLLVGIIATLLSFLFGTFMARRISKPILNAIESAKMISKGNFGKRISENSNTREIFELAKTINNLSETLNKQDIIRKRISADVAHELRTPIATLQSYIEAMIDGVWEVDKERLKSCHEEISRITRMVGDLEKLTNYESSNLILNKDNFNLKELIEGIIKNYENEFIKKNIELMYNGQNIDLSADRDKLSQVIINLLSNSLKYTESNGTVEINTYLQDDFAVIKIKDTGIGISEEDLPHIFERFYRVDKSRNRSTGGVGIGLTIVKSIIENHGGNITVSSKLGEGTMFTVKLPRN